MNIIRTGVIFIILTTLGILFDRYKKKYWGDEELDKYSLVRKYLLNESDGFVNVGKLSENSVSYYVELSLAQEFDATTPNEDEIEISPEQIAEHPLMQWEIATQNELFDFLSSASENKASCIKAKALVLEEGLSNLGIEISA